MLYRNLYKKNYSIKQRKKKTKKKNNKPSQNQRPNPTPATKTKPKITPKPIETLLFRFKKHPSNLRLFDAPLLLASKKKKIHSINEHL